MIIGPPLVDFGKVCLRSTSRRDISIVNNLDSYIHIVVQVFDKETLFQAQSEESNELELATHAFVIYLFP